MEASDKTSEVRLRLFNDILHGRIQPGERLPTEREMAETSGVSRVTIRRAYALLESSGIVERKQGSGTFVSTQVRGNPEKGDQVALLTTMQDVFVLQFINSLEQELSKRGALLVLRLTNEDAAQEERLAIELVARGIINLVVWPSGAGYAQQTFARLRVLGTNMVFFDRLHPGPFADFVGLDNRHAIEQLLAHAHAHGARQFLFLSHSELNADSDREREEYFTASCVARGWPHRIERVPWRGDSYSLVAENIEAWAPRQFKTAILCVNDDLALEVCKARQSNSLVYGIDGLPEALRAGVVTYRQPMAKMARQVIKFLFDQQLRAHDWQARRAHFKGDLLDPHA